MHVNLYDPDATAVTRLVELGATIVGEHEIGDGGQSWTVMQDPEGNEFCVAATVYKG
jgi:hypothetical protein